MVLGLLARDHLAIADLCAIQVGSPPSLHHELEIPNTGLQAFADMWFPPLSLGPLRRSGVDQSQGIRLAGGELAALRATSHLTFRKGSLCLAMDASRVGKPGKEILLGALSVPQVGAHVGLPPQARMWKCHIKLHTPIPLEVHVTSYM